LESGFLHYDLYQTKHGAFFACWWHEDSGAAGINPLSDDEAQKWLEDHGAKASLIEKYFGEFPEGGAAESRITLRLPGNLYQQVLASATARNESLNTYIMRLLERSERDSAANRH
jgi:hypothetical protein